jgi:hypothetical protein
MARQFVNPSPSREYANARGRGGGAAGDWSCARPLFTASLPVVRREVWSATRPGAGRADPTMEHSCTVTTPFADRLYPLSAGTAVSAMPARTPERGFAGRGRRLRSDRATFRIPPFDTVGDPRITHKSFPPFCGWHAGPHPAARIPVHTAPRLGKLTGHTSEPGTATLLVHTGYSSYRAGARRLDFRVARPSVPVVYVDGFPVSWG